MGELKPRIDSQCAFCKFYPDTHSHIFSQCNELKFLWRFLDEVLLMMKISPSVYNFTDSRRKYDYDLIHTVVNYNIWRYRNDCRYRFKEFNLKDLMSRIAKSIGYRKGD